jgi:mannose-1-phosphate guanylyltransferase
MGSRPLGIYAFASRVLEHIPLRGYQDIKESLIPRLYELGETVSLCPLPGTTRRVMGPASYLTVNHHAVERLPDGAWPLAGYEQIGEAFVHPTAWVAPSARLAGPVVVGPGAVVHERAAVIGPASIGAACDIGSRSVVCFSALWDGVRIGTDCHVDGSILASGVQVPAGSKAVNLVRLSRSENADCNVNSELDLAVAPPRAVKNRAGRREGAADVGPPARRTPAASNEHR